MLCDYLSSGNSRALDVGVQLFRLDDPVVGIKGVFATQGADLIL